MSGFVLHPEAYADLDEIWEFIGGWPGDPCAFLRIIIRGEDSTVPVGVQRGGGCPTLGL